MKRNETLLIRLTKEEKKELERRAKATSSSMSSVVRKAIYSGRDTHIEEWMLQTIQRGQINGAVQMKAERLLENIRAFEGHVPKAAFRKMEENILGVIEDCAMLRRRFRDDLAEMRREIGLPPIKRPQHKIKTLADANLKYWQEAAREAGIDVVAIDEADEDVAQGINAELEEIFDMLSDEDEEHEIYTSQAHENIRGKSQGEAGREGGTPLDDQEEQS